MKDSKAAKEKEPINVLGIKPPGSTHRIPRINSDDDGFNAINRSNNQNQKEYNSKDNLMPNPDDFDEGDDEDSEGKGSRTPGL